MVHTQDPAIRTDGWLLPLAAHPPAWLPALLGSARPSILPTPHPSLGDLHVASAEGVAHVSVSIPDAAHLSAAALEAAVAAAYASITAALSQAGSHPVRFWNFIPGIHAAMGADDDRYMVFNAGRFAAFASVYGSPAAFSRALPTASAVGVREGPLVVHGLGLADAGLPLENPRQVPAYSYSRRYGPRPPCFARATLVRAPGAASPWLLVGGTASILGEDSMHLRNAERQALETFDNLARLITSARIAAAAANDGAAHRPSSSDASASYTPATTGRELAAFRELRVYIVRDEDASTLRAMVEDRFPDVTRVEYARADLCRQELLVEVEGVAVLDA